jgi:hypothetical protein
MTMNEQKKNLASDVMIGLIIATLTSLTTAGATTYVTTRILETQLLTMQQQVERNREKIDKVSDEQQRRTYIIDQARRQFQGVSPK